MSDIIQLDLISEFKKEIPNLKKPKFKRVHYKIPTYKKVYKNDIQDDGFVKDDVATWGKIKDLQNVLTDYVGFNPFSEETIQEINGVRVWNVHYLPENYIYRGKQYKGQDFRVIESEIIGTEDLHITDRLYLHEHLLNELRAGLPLSEAMVDIRFMLNLIQKGYTLNQSKYVLKTIKER